MRPDKANLFVVGAMRAGSTSFLDILSSSMEVFVPPIKEPHYFADTLPANLYSPSRFFSIEKYFEKEFPKPLHNAKVDTPEQYFKLFSLRKNEKYLVDGSTAYLHAPESSSKIFDYNNQAKIIILVRNPIERAFSHYKMDIGLGRTKESFENIIKNEIKLYQDDKLTWNSYIGMSLYNSAIDRYKDLFGDNVLVVSFENLIRNPEMELKTVSKFLKVNLELISGIPNKNKARKLRSLRFFYFLNRLGIKDYFSQFFSSKIKKAIFKLISSNQNQLIELSEETRYELEKIFKEDAKILN